MIHITQIKRHVNGIEPFTKHLLKINKRERDKYTTVTVMAVLYAHTHTHTHTHTHKEHKCNVIL